MAVSKRRAKLRARGRFEYDRIVVRIWQEVMELYNNRKNRGIWR